MISTTAEYALRATVFLATRHGQPTSRQDIAGATNVPLDYLLKVLGTLDAAGIVRSKRGPGGGYWLGDDPAEISALDVVEAVDSIPRIRRCPLGISRHAQLCPLHRLLDAAAAKVEEAFRKVSIGDLASAKRSLPACAFPRHGTGGVR